MMKLRKTYALCVCFLGMIFLIFPAAVSCRGETSESAVSSDTEKAPATTVEATLPQTTTAPAPVTYVSPVWLAVMEFVWSEQDRAYLVDGVSDGVEKVFIPFAYNPSGGPYGTVIAVGKDAFAGDHVMKQLTMEENIRRIEEGGFQNCIALQEVYCAATLTEIGKEAFCGCVSLTKIRLSDGLTTIGERAFYGCVKLSEISLSNSVRSIGVGAFEGVEGLTVIYRGTVAEWNAIVGASGVRCTVVCSDGKVMGS